MDCSSSVCSILNSFPSVVDDPYVLLHKSTSEMINLCSGEEVKYIGCINPIIGNLIISDREGNLIAGSLDEEQNGQLVTMNIYSTRITGVFSVYKGIIDTSEDVDLATEGILDLSDEGDRWEGMIFKGKPFGWGSLINSRNLFSYVGFMISGKRIGFGFDYFPDIENEIVEYEGNYCFDQRFGIGRIYDLQGNLLSEGLIDDSLTQIIPAYSDDIVRLRSWIKSLIIQSHCCRYKSFCSFSFDALYLLSQLKTLSIESYCFQHFESFRLHNLYLLESVYIASSSFVLSDLKQEVFHQDATFSIQNCNNLKTVTIDDGSFQFFGLFQLSGLKSLETLTMNGSNFTHAQSFCLKSN